MNTIEKGRKGEQLAIDFLKKKGIEIIAKNVRTEYGEIDIIARHNAELLFIEVKTRYTKEFGEPETAITHQKRKHMINSARAYLMENYEKDPVWRIDVIAINMNKKGKSTIRWFKNAINE